MGGDTLHVHFGQCQIHGALAPSPSLQCARIEAALAHLRHREADLADAGEHGLILKPIGVCNTCRPAFVRADANELFALDQTVLINKDAKRFACAVEALFYRKNVALPLQRVHVQARRCAENESAMLPLIL